MDLEHLEFCTFTPESNNPKVLFNTQKKNVYKRLYEDNKRRIRNISLQRSCQEKHFSDLSIQKHRKKLYGRSFNDKFKTKGRSTSTFIEQEGGITFKSIHLTEEKNSNNNNNNNNNNYNNKENSNSRKDFHQRNKDFLKSRNLYSKLYYKILSEAFQLKRSYAAYEIEKIRTDVLNRLYFNEIEKIRVKKIFDKHGNNVKNNCFKYNKEFNRKKELNNFEYYESNNFENDFEEADNYNAKIPKRERSLSASAFFSGSPVAKIPLNFQ